MLACFFGLGRGECVSRELGRYFEWSRAACQEKRVSILNELGHLQILDNLKQFFLRELAAVAQARSRSPAPRRAAAADSSGDTWARRACDRRRSDGCARPR